MLRTSPRRAGVLLATAAGGALALTGVAAPVSAADGQIGVGQQASKDLELVSNTPKSGAFAAADAFSTDLAFQDDYAYQGNYNGFTVWDLDEPQRPRELAQVVCPGSQNDISVSGDLLFLSTDSRRTDSSCASQPSPSGADYWEGIKVFDISDPREPEYVTAVETDCGSHTQTLVPGQDDETLYLYVSSYGPNSALVDCQPPHDKISIVEVPVDEPERARVLSEPVLFPDGGFPGDGPTTPEDVATSATSGCHDITVFPERDIAAGACMGDGVLWDISDRTRLVEIDRVQDDANFAFWHSATFNNAGTKVVFTDELGGGGAATCTAGSNPVRGANGIYDIRGKGARAELVFRSYYKIPRANSATENCVAHNGSLVPVPGRDIMVQSWYQGGISVFDFTNSGKPVELAWFDRGPLSDTTLVLGGTWSAYWYNGTVYSSDIQLGFDALELQGKQFERAERVEYDVLNVQSQPVFDTGKGRG